MKRPVPVISPALLALGVLAAPTMVALAQSSAAPFADSSGSSLKRTPWGHPDLTGTFSSDDMRGVPMPPLTPEGEAIRAAQRPRGDEDYEVTIDDPGLYTAPSTIAMPLTTQPNYSVLPYECHEGNHALANILSAARAEEAAAAEE